MNVHTKHCKSRFEYDNEVYALEINSFLHDQDYVKPAFCPDYNPYICCKIESKGNLNLIKCNHHKEKARDKLNDPSATYFDSKVRMLE